MMRVYIASRYIFNAEINRKIYFYLINAGISAFLPESIKIDAVSDEEMKTVGDICYNELKKSDIVLVVTPFGNSVSAEIGYAKSSDKHIICFGSNHKREAMITPYFEAIVDPDERRRPEDFKELICTIQSLINTKKTSSKQ